MIEKKKRALTSAVLLISFSSVSKKISSFLFFFKLEINNINLNLIRKSVYTFMISRRAVAILVCISSSLFISKSSGSELTAVVNLLVLLNI